jgi:acetyltransferase-like isoleucine patch superfamily enzyme
MIQVLKNVIWFFIKLFPLGKKIYETRHSQTPVTFKLWFMQKVLGFNKKAYWPVHFTSRISSPENIYAGVDTCPGYMNNCYIQGLGKIYIGDYTQVAPGVGIISSNHDLYDSRIQQTGEVRIGKYCWLGMHSIILPAVVLGDFTIVAAGSVVTKSFPEGHCVIGGVPAQKIKDLEPEKCIPFKNEIEYNGYIRKSSFEAFRLKKLKV